MKKTTLANEENPSSDLGAILAPIWEQLDELGEKPLRLEETQRTERPGVEHLAERKSCESGQLHDPAPYAMAASTSSRCS